MSDFSDRPFVAGSLTGIRSFKADQYGRLTGVNFPGVWTSGETEARCGKAYASLHNPFASFTLPGFLPELPRSGAGAKEPKHRPGSIGCACGFYAYFDTDANPHHEKGQTVGLVEGSGVATVGTRGFRCEKARIVALIDGPLAGRGGWLAHTSLLARLWLGLGACETLFGVGLGVVKHSWLSALPTFVVGAVLVAVVLCLRDRPPMRGTTGSGSSTVPEAVRRNYPDVPIYPNLTAALAEHPLTPPPPPTPESDPEFWTRGAVL